MNRFAWQQYTPEQRSLELTWFDEVGAVSVGAGAESAGAASIGGSAGATLVGM
jgi:hypothetical protein